VPAVAARAPTTIPAASTRSGRKESEMRLIHFSLSVWFLD
jgi:hypothetical protein